MVKKYIILADSSIGFELPKQLSVVCGEPIIKRTIRLLKENGINDITITSHDKRFDNLGAIRYEPKFNDYNPADPKSAWLKAFPIELMEEPTCYLFGDVYYSENAIKTIVEKDNNDILFFCTYENKSPLYIKHHDEPLAFKVHDFDKFKSSDEFEFEGYNYTFSESVPLATAAADYNNSLFDKDFTNNTLGVIDAASVRTATDNVANKLEEDYAEFRGKVLCRNGERIYMTDFSNELFRTYRDGDESTSKITVDFSYLRNAKTRFFDYSETKKHIDRQYKQIETSYKDLEKQVQDIVKRNGDLNAKAFLDRMPDSSDITKIDKQTIDADIGAYTMSSEVMSALDIYVKAKVDQIQEYSNIHTMAFAAKLDALSEAYRQDKVTLYTALTRIQRTDKKREEF